MTNALFINGIYDSVLTEILDAQGTPDGGDSYLQPHKGSVILMLRKRQPTPKNSIRLYVSTTANLSHICYTGLIVGWEDKRELSQRRRNEVGQHLEKYQPDEVKLFQGVEEAGKKAVNLITIRDLRKLDTLHPRTLLRKVSDAKPYSRPRPGGWSEVHNLGDWIDLPSDTQNRYDEELAEAVAASSELSDAALRKHLKEGAKLPDKVQIISTSYRRNPHVIVAVLRRAGGVCERCEAEAPFLRRAGGSPYLEVHHWTLLSQGGEDTLENAAALCPNCHREVHYGQTKSEHQPSTAP